MRSPGLLVSVVNAEEAAVAAASGAAVVDAKDPSRGALGAVSAPALAGILAACPPGIETSAALGDLGGNEHPAAGLALTAGGSTVVSGTGGHRLTYVKVGLGGCESRAGARRSLRRFAEKKQLRPAAGAPLLIVATYADHARGRSPAPGEVPALAREAGALGCLLDTAVKDGSCLLDWIDEAGLAGFVRACREQGLLCALAGSLRAEHLPRMALLGPDLIGVRGAACDGDRVHGRVSGPRVARLAGSLAAAGI